MQSSFLWGYLLSPIAGGALVDYYGGKVVMAWGVALWSLATFLTPWAAETSIWALFSMRVLLGIAEGVALPCMNNMISRSQCYDNHIADSRHFCFRSSRNLKFSF